MELETSQDMRAHFKVPFEPGVLRVVGHFADGSECSEVLHTPADPAAVVLTSDKETLLADGRDIAFVEISTVDVNGIPVGNARNRIRVEVSGAGRLVGLDNGDSTDYDSYKGDNRRLFSGKLLAMIESTPGNRRNHPSVRTPRGLRTLNSGLSPRTAGKSAASAL